jgi:hypothetical protein
MPNDDRETRYAHTSGSGANQPKKDDRKEQRPDWQPRQGEDQSREKAAQKDEHLEPPIDPEEREKVR